MKRSPHFFSCIRSTLDCSGTSNGIGNVVAHMAGQNCRAKLHASMLFVDKAPKVSERDGFMPQSAVRATLLTAVNKQL
jgi:hypothetical protein